MPRPHDPDALRARIAAFFADNPHEWLSVDDVAVKFDAAIKDVYLAVENLRRNGYRVRREIVYHVEVEGQ